MLKAQKVSKAKQGWRFVSYHDEGMKSYALFLVPKLKVFRYVVIIGVIVAVLIAGTLLIPKKGLRRPQKLSTGSSVEAPRNTKSTSNKKAKKKSTGTQKKSEVEDQQKDKQKGNALLWQEAGYDVKLATCNALTAAMWKQKMFKPEIQRQILSTEELKVYSVALLKALDKAFLKDPDPVRNRRMFEGERIEPTAVRLAQLLGWLK